MGEDTAFYQELFQKGKVFLETELYNGEYFYQKIQTEGLKAQFHPAAADQNGSGYQQYCLYRESAGAEIPVRNGLLVGWRAGFLDCSNVRPGTDC